MGCLIPRTAGFIRSQVVRRGRVSALGIKEGIVVLPAIAVVFGLFLHGQ